MRTLANPAGGSSCVTQLIRSFPLALAMPLLSACAVDSAITSPSAPQAPVQSEAGSSAALANQYIVTFRDSVSVPPGLVGQLVRTSGANLRFTYRKAIRGFSASMSEG